MHALHLALSFTNPHSVPIQPEEGRYSESVLLRACVLLRASLPPIENALHATKTENGD